MGSYLARRLLVLPAMLFAVSLLAFGIAWSVPAERRALAGVEKHVSPEQLRATIVENGWDRPFLVQYWRYLGNLCSGDLGRSIERRSNVATDLVAKFPATIELALASMAIAAMGGILVGIASAYARGSALDKAAMLYALVGVSVPVFWLALMVKELIIAYLSVPLISAIPPDTWWTRIETVDALIAVDPHRFAVALRRLLIPAFVLATVPLAVIARITRAAMLEVLGADYVRTARAKGLGEVAVLLRHALKSAALPIATIVGMQLGYLLGGAVLTETIFDWDGLGKYVARAVLANDFAPVQAGVLVMASAFALVNLVVDLSYPFLDPRVTLA